MAAYSHIIDNITLNVQLFFKMTIGSGEHLEPLLSLLTPNLSEFIFPLT